MAGKRARRKRRKAETVREILFRGKHTHVLPLNEHLDGTWVYGYLCDENHINAVDEDKHGGKFTSKMLVDPETVCQYTGLPDKNNRKIFESDIFKYHFDESIIGIVRYGAYKNPFNDDEHAGHVGFYVDWLEKRDRFRADLGYWAKVSEVIGNIFDNQELVKQHESGC